MFIKSVISSQKAVRLVKYAFLKSVLTTPSTPASCTSHVWTRFPEQQRLSQGSQCPELTLPAQRQSKHQVPQLFMYLPPKSMSLEQEPMFTLAFLYCSCSCRNICRFPSWTLTDEALGQFSILSQSLCSWMLLCTWPCFHLLYTFLYLSFVRNNLFLHAALLPLLIPPCQFLS